MFALCLSHYLPCLYIWGSLRVGRRKPKVRRFIAAIPPHRTTTCTDLDRPNADTAWPLYSKDVYSTWSPHAQSFKWGLQNFQIGWVAMHNAAPVIFISPYLQKYYPAARQKQDERDDFPRDWKELPAVTSQHINALFDIWRSPFLRRELIASLQNCSIEGFPPPSNISFHHECACIGGWGVGGCSLIQLMQNQCNVRLDRPKWTHPLKEEHTLYFFLVLDLIYLNLRECVWLFSSNANLKCEKKKKKRKKETFSVVKQSAKTLWSNLVSRNTKRHWW